MRKFKTTVVANGRTTVFTLTASTLRTAQDQAQRRFGRFAQTIQTRPA